MSCPLFQMWRKEVKAMEKLEELEGNLVKEVSSNSEDKNAFGIGGLEEGEVKVRGTLLRNVKAWEDAGAGAFALGVIKDGFKLNMNQMPEAYEEGNNKSFKKDEEFAIEAVRKLVKLEILKEVERGEVSCVNPLTVAINGVGKKCLCIDLSRYVNDFTTTAKFRIESTLQFLQVVKVGDYLYAQGAGLDGARKDSAAESHKEQNRGPRSGARRCPGLLLLDMVLDKHTGGGLVVLGLVLFLGLGLGVVLGLGLLLLGEVLVERTGVGLVDSLV